MLNLENLAQIGLAFLAAVVAGVLNAVAGGGSIVAFPTLVWLGIPAIEANATNALALWPGGLSGTWGFRREFNNANRWYRWLAIPSLLGGGLGAFLLLHTPPDLFKAMAPYLVLGATLILAFQRQVRTDEVCKVAGPSKSRLLVALATTLGIAVYGGYFGAGLGILLLVALGLIGLSDLNEKNGIKNLYTLAIKGIAVLCFALAGRVVWAAAIPMALGALGGGWLGAALQYRIGQEKMRRVILAIGFGMTIASFWGM